MLMFSTGYTSYDAAANAAEAGILGEVSDYDRRVLLGEIAEQPIPLGAKQDITVSGRGRKRTKNQQYADYDVQDASDEDDYVLKGSTPKKTSQAPKLPVPAITDSSDGKPIFINYHKYSSEHVGGLIRE